VIYGLLFVLASWQGEEGQALEYFARAGSLGNLWMGQQWWLRLRRGEDVCTGQGESAQRFFNQQERHEMYDKRASTGTESERRASDSLQSEKGGHHGQ
jgi:hypothetical protein